MLSLKLRLFVFFIALLIGQTLFAAPVKILPLGDSITAGDGPTPPNALPSYRRDLWHMLINAGYDIDFVGSLDDYTGTPIEPILQDFDPDYEGHSAWEAGDLDDSIAGWLLGYDVDIALIHAGTNDIDRGQSIASTLIELGSIITKLRADNPNVIILIAQIIPMRNQDTAAFNNDLVAWAPSQYLSNSPVIVVDQYTGFDPFVDNYDNYHPNASGEFKMATRWYTALVPILDGVNQAPIVEAGANRFVPNVGDSITLAGSVLDDNMPAGTSLVIQWSQLSSTGTGTTTFIDASLPTSDVSFSAEGTYVLQLFADDSDLTATDTMTVQVGNVDTLTGLAGHWTLDETSGSVANDASGNANHGTLRNISGNPWVSGQLAGGLLLDGIDDDAAVSVTTDLQPSSLTLSAWVKVDASLADWGWIAGEGDNYGLFVDRRNGKNNLVFYFYNGSTWVDVRVTNTLLADGQWHHVAATFDEATGIIRLYVNTVEVTSKTVGGSIVYARGDSFHIGSMQGSRYLNGSVDDVRLYNRVLDQSGIVAVSTAN